MEAFTGKKQTNKDVGYTHEHKNLYFIQARNCSSHKNAGVLSESTMVMVIVVSMSLHMSVEVLNLNGVQCVCETRREMRSFDFTLFFETIIIIAITYML